jgi:hypothetical protein
MLRGYGNFVKLKATNAFGKSVSVIIRGPKGLQKEGVKAFIKGISPNFLLVSLKKR